MLWVYVWCDIRLECFSDKQKDTKVSMCIEIIENPKLISPTTLSTPCVKCRVTGSGADPMVRERARRFKSMLQYWVCQGSLVLEFSEKYLWIFVKFLDNVVMSNWDYWKGLQKRSKFIGYSYLLMFTWLIHWSRNWPATGHSISSVVSTFKISGHSNHISLCICYECICDAM